MCEDYPRRVCAVIWTFNPYIKRFMKVLESICNQVDQVVIVDNGSGNISDVKSACYTFKNVVLIELGFNSGVHALNVGMEYAVEKFKPSFILLLDDDAAIHPNAVQTCSRALEDVNLCKIIGVVQMVSHYVPPNWRGKLIVFWSRGIFSGSLIKAELIKRGLKVREEFFLDQADYDFYNQVRRLGFLTVVYGEKLIDHEIGVKVLLPSLRRPYKRRIWVYEPSWRYYYVVRNSTVLLVERGLDVKTYIEQLIAFAVPSLFVDGISKTLKAVVLGTTHGLFRKLGFLNPGSIGLSPKTHDDRLNRRVLNPI
ncbi:glycosyltransferase [Candidatus Bathyarchaeota archaeon]|nr:glycosyltransferase [Candidatus Bathyarchaeota archaeon]